MDSAMKRPVPERTPGRKTVTLGRVGNLETRLASSAHEVRQAQKLRYDIFYRELGAVPDPDTARTQRDADRYDPYCDHLLVVDRQAAPEGRIVGTYRMMFDRGARKAGGFYSQNEFDLSSLIDCKPRHRLMELGRSCILAPYRSKRTMELLWHGVWACALQNQIDIMFGCASFQGTDLQKVSPALAWLGKNVSLDNSGGPASRNREAFALSKCSNESNSRGRALALLPPVLKGYLRLGARVGSHAVIDRQFGTIDVLVVLRVADINARYLTHYGTDASRFAA